MALDSVFLSALTKELEGAITGAKIDRVDQPGRSDLVLSLRGPQGRCSLFLGGSSGSGRIGLTNMEYEKPSEPPMFCMLLRKHLIGARITEITQPENERIIKIKLDAPGVFGEGEERGLITELFGRNANVILTDGEGIITDCLYRIGSAEDKRALQPGMRYKMPEAQNKKVISRLSDSEIADIFRVSDGETPADRWIIKSFMGFSPLTARETVWRTCGTAAASLRQLEVRTFIEQLRYVSGMVGSSRAKPYMIFSPEGQPFDFSYIPILQYGPDYESRQMESYSKLLESFWGRRGENDRRKQRTASLLKTVKGIRDRTARRLENQCEELSAASNREYLRENGDIITSNLHLMKKGMTQLKAFDFYAEDGGERIIPLDPLKTPQQNAAKYYRDYSKLKRAEVHLSEQIAAGKAELNYLESVCDELIRAETVRDVTDIRAELTDGGLIRKQSGGKREKRRSEGPMTFRSDAGYEIRVGRNNVQNDALTLKSSAKTDMWLHTQKIHGSHVVISCSGVMPDEETIMQAAALAAFYSQARQGKKVPVDYTLVKYVKKPAGARPGMVTYTDYKTVYADPDEELTKRLRTK